MQYSVSILCGIVWYCLPELLIAHSLPAISCEHLHCMLFAGEDIEQVVPVVNCLDMYSVPMSDKIVSTLILGKLLWTSEP